MDIDYEIDGDILLIHQNGVTDPEKIVQAMGIALKEPDLLPCSHLLWDAVDAPAQASAEKMKKLLAGIGSANSILSSRFALVVASKLQYGVSRMFTVYAEDQGITSKVFYDIVEAKKWLREK
jgi:hypothetical protein